MARARSQAPRTGGARRQGEGLLVAASGTVRIVATHLSGRGARQQRRMRDCERGANTVVVMLLARAMDRKTVAKLPQPFRSGGVRTWSFLRIFPASAPGRILARLVRGRLGRAGLGCARTVLAVYLGAERRVRAAAGLWAATIGGRHSFSIQQGVLFRAAQSWLGMFPCSFWDSCFWGRPRRGPFAKCRAPFVDQQARFTVAPLTGWASGIADVPVRARDDRAWTQAVHESQSRIQGNRAVR
jgi:hypothetical protein